MTALPRACRWIGLCAVLLLPAAAQQAAPGGELILYGGEVVTLDDRGTVAEAVRVRNGRIEAVGRSEEILRQAAGTAARIDLHGQALLPGFIEPHLHLDMVALTAGFTHLDPCLPAWYETRTHCPLTILAAMGTLRDSKPAAGAWLLGSGIDPSVMSLDGSRPSSLFAANPAHYIEHYVSATRPVFILDKSFHLAYVNRQAFVAAGICERVEDCSPRTARKPEPASPGAWGTDRKGAFNGRLEEQQSLVDFAAAIPQPCPEEIIARAEVAARELARAGITTIVNGGTGIAGTGSGGSGTGGNGAGGAGTGGASGVGEGGTGGSGAGGTGASGAGTGERCKGGGMGTLQLLQALAARSRNHPLLRYRTLLPWGQQGDTTQGFAGPVPWDEGTAGLFGVTGIKLWVDGSLQGCTAALIDPYSKLGHCAAGGRGMADLTEAQIVAELAPLWKAGWPIQLHVNGDRATLNVLQALAALQADHRNGSPITLLHFTLDGNPARAEDVVQQVADLRAGKLVHRGRAVPPVDVRVSHLIGHVAYWGGALENILDGVHGPGRPDEKGRAARIDATARDVELGVPFSLHSDAPVSPARPLWYVEQAVTRNTWFYPRILASERRPMPGGQNASIAQALRAVTLEAARQHGLDRYVGSIEIGKVADLVVLDRNPLRQPAGEIHRIRVLATFVGGYENDWSKE
jgi:predicted amidohydrolase YtcJ